MDDKISKTHSCNIKNSRKEKSLTIPKIAIVGCGAIAEMYHLPGLAKNPTVLGKSILVDMNEDRLHELSSQFNVDYCVQDYHEILDKVDGAILAVPPKLHYPISMEFLGKGVHILCEKPLAESSVEAKKMVAQAQKYGATISVNHTRRLFPAYSEIKKIILNGTIGKLISIDYVDGEFFQWPTASGFYFMKGSRKGVLFDRGVHGLDTICWWLGEKPKVISSENDSFGGVEGVVLLKLLHNNCSIDVKLSWLTKLKNTFTIHGELGKIEGEIEGWDKVTTIYNSGKKKISKLNVKERVYSDFGHKMVANFIDVVSKGAKPLVDASEVISSIELIEECYKNSKRFTMPWIETMERFNGK